MKKFEFEELGITAFTPKEIEATGAVLGDVQPRLVLAMQAFRDLIGRRVWLLVNGMTTGKHSAKEHPAGLAFDGYLAPEDGAISVDKIFKCALEAGFKGIGIYHNGQAYSFHLDLRPAYAFWTGRRVIIDGKKEWKYGPLLIDF